MEKKRILFADDDPEIREALRLLLNSEGYETVEANCGKEVLDLIDQTFDLVILDVMMPEMNGFSAGGDDYLVKPFSYNELLNRVKAILRRYYVYGAKSVEPSFIIRCCGNVEIDTRQSILL